MKDAPRQQFRQAPHVSGAANAKPKDYESLDEVEADNEYAAWAVLRGSERPLCVGDILEAPGGQLRICKYVGFEEARWLLAETKAAEPMADSGPPVSAAPQPAAQA
jgi:hypothetical protein